MLTYITDRAFHQAALMRHSRKTIRKFDASPNHSTLYEDWLRAQPAAYRAELLAAEREFLAAHSAKLRSLELVFADSMEGYQDSPAGDKPRELFSGTGDWSWQPQRYCRDPGYTFIREEVDSLNDGWTHYESDERRAELEAQMPTYRPTRHPRACPSCHLTTCPGPGHHELADIQAFQQRARTPHREAGDYNRHTHDYSIP